jgi:hypothetical protein
LLSEARDAGAQYGVASFASSGLCVSGAILVRILSCGAGASALPAILAEKHTATTRCRLAAQVLMRRATL